MPTKRATRAKVAVSVPRRLIDQARAEVQAGRAESLSQLMADALAEKLTSQTLADILKRWDEDYGPPSQEDDAWARRVLGV